MFVSDEDLMVKCGKGDMSAFELLVRRYQNPLINYIHRSIDDYQRAEDLSQETFLRVFKSANRYEADGIVQKLALYNCHEFVSK